MISSVFKATNTITMRYSKGSSALVLLSVFAPCKAFTNLPANALIGRFQFSTAIDRSIAKLNLSSYNRDDASPESERESFRTPDPLPFRKGNPVQVEITRFGPLGASVEIIAKTHEENDLIPEDEPPLGYGLILQEEIGYFRAARNDLDVVVGEILPAYVSWVRDDGKVDISLRKPGGKGKAEDLSVIIFDALKESANGEIEVGDKSSPHEINKFFPGASKASFKRAVANLYKKKIVQPGAHTTKLL